MVDILHRIGAKGATPTAAYDAVGTAAGVASWWLGDTTGDDATGGTLRFAPGLAATLVEKVPQQRVRWRFTEGPDEWLGTDVAFDIKREDDYTVVLFRHEGWAEPKEFMHHCSTKWAVFLLSLKRLLETGTGAPTPHDTHIDNWS